MDFSLNPKQLWNAVKSVPGKVADAAEGTAGYVKDAAVETAHVAKYLHDHPPSVDVLARSLQAIGQTLKTGETAVVTADMPAYAALDPAERAAAYQRGEGRTIVQPHIASNADGTHPHEPVNLTVRGSKADLVAALKGQGWMMAPALGLRNNLEMAGKFILGTERDVNGPVSLMFVNGKPAEMAFSKNDDYNAGRDHLRVFDGGVDPKTGEQIWQIAATRDTAATITVKHPEWHGLMPDFYAPSTGHRTDPEIDRERDLIMHDLLASGLVSEWAAVKGDRPEGGEAETRLPDGRVQLGSRKTDGYVYDVALQPKPEEKPEG